jgi:arylsulfatase
MSGDRPNILLIFTDQLRADAIGALGNSVIRTPNLDRICSEGIAFTNTYSPCPVCVPARMSMLYGQYPHATKCYENHYTIPEDEKQSFAAALTDAGYRTHAIGKCHHRPDPHALRGYQTRERQEELPDSPDEDEYLKFLHNNGYSYVCDPYGIRGEMYYIPQPSQLPQKFHPTQWVADRSVEFIEEQAQNHEPWMLFSSYIHPHPPFTPPNPWHQLYRTPQMPLPMVPDDVESLQIYINRFQNRYKHRGWGIDVNLVLAIKAYYYACISFIDLQVGRLLDTLEKSGQLDNTLIMFTSDHGEYLGDYNCFGKRGMHNPSVKIPMILRLPGRFPEGQLCDRPASLVDIFPTVLSAANTDIKTHRADGTDLAEIAAGTSGRQIVFSQFKSAGEAVYMAANKGYKYFYSAPDNREFLFDLVEDPLETKNLAGISSSSEALTNMKRALFKHLIDGGETQGIQGGDWKVFPTKEIPEDPRQGLLFQDSQWAETRIDGYSCDQTPQS